MIDSEEGNSKPYVEEPPPFGKKWSRLYTFVILNHIIVIVLFYIITLLLS